MKHIGGDDLKSKILTYTKEEQAVFAKLERQLYVYVTNNMIEQKEKTTLTWDRFKRNLNDEWARVLFMSTHRKPLVTHAEMLIECKNLCFVNYEEYLNECLQQAKYRQDVVDYKKYFNELVRQSLETPTNKD